MKENGLMIKRMDTDAIFMKTDQSMRGNGRMIDNKVTVSKHGQMGLGM